MKKFIEVHITDKDGAKTCIINTDAIEVIYPCNDQPEKTLIAFGRGPFMVVDESYEQLRSDIANIQGGFHIRVGTETVKELD